MSTTKAKSRFTGWKRDRSSRGLVRVGLAFRSGITSRKTSKPASGPEASRVSSVAGWNSPKGPRTVFGPSLIVPVRPGWYQAGAAASICNWSTGARRLRARRGRRPWRRTRRPARHFRTNGGRRLRVSQCHGGHPTLPGAGFPECRLHRFPTLRTMRHRRNRDPHCAGTQRSVREAATAACLTYLPRSDWQASTPAARPRTARHALPE